MWNRPFEDIGEEEILLLQEEGTPEGPRLEYKRDLPGGSKSDKINFLREVCAFANASGGYLIFGIAGDEGVPTDVLGVQAQDEDGAILRLENLINSRAEPPVPGIHIRAIGAFERGPIIALQVPNSWVSPLPRTWLQAKAAPVILHGRCERITHCARNVSDF